MELFLSRRVVICRKVFRDRQDPFDCEASTFFKRYRFTKEAALFIIDELKHHLKRRTKRSKAFPIHLIVLISLNILGTGTFQFVSGQIDLHDLQQSAVSKVFSEFTSALVTKTKKFIMFPKSEEQVRDTKLEFYRKYGFPNVIGAIDCMHIAIQKPSVWDAYCFFNRKAYYSINVQAICDSNACFNDVVVRWPGSTHDSHIYKSSSVYCFLHSHEFQENTWLRGDNGYSLQHCLLTPVIRPSTASEKKYNEYHTKTRKIIEQAFGILKSRFRILSKSGGMLCYGLEKCVNIILCCFILHNIAKTRRVPVPDPGDYQMDNISAEDEDGDEQIASELQQSSSSIRGRSIRNNLISNFQNI